MINYHNKTFRSVNSTGGEVDSRTVFYYRQLNNVVTANYSGGKIVHGQLIGKVGEKGEIEMAYHHLNDEGKIMTGKCISTPEIMNNGKKRLYEKWQWTCGDLSSGESVIEEIDI